VALVRLLLPPCEDESASRAPLALFQTPESSGRSSSNIGHPQPLWLTLSSVGAGNVHLEPSGVRHGRLRSALPQIYNVEEELSPFLALGGSGEGVVIRQQGHVVMLQVDS
jgi:hypothetical protein